MTSTLFSRPIDLPAGWQEQSTYVYVLDEPGPEPQACSEVGAGPLLAGLRPSGSAKPEHKPNVVIIRLGHPERPLAEHAEQQRRLITERMPDARLVREASGELAGCPAQERTYELALKPPHPVVVQRHVTAVIDGQAFHVCCTATKDRYAACCTRFDELLRAWRP